MIKIPDTLRLSRAEAASKNADRAAMHSAETAEIAFVVMAENGQIDDVTATEHAAVFIPWAAGQTVQSGNIRSYPKGGAENGEICLYRCISAHTTQADWTPDAAPALWVKIGDPTEEWPNWSQPLGAHDAYAEGAKVTHNGKHWTSDIPANVYEPGVYGWTEVEDA